MDILRAVADLFLYAGHKTFEAYLLPKLIRDNRLMPAVEQLILGLFDAVIFVAGAFDFLVFVSAIGDFAGINRVVQYSLDKGFCDTAVQVVLASVLCIAIRVEPLRNAGVAQVGVCELFKDDANQPGFGFLNRELALFQLVTVGGLSAVPLALPRFLPASGHGLRLDVLALQLRYSGQNGKKYLPSGGSGINAVLNAHEIDAVVLHELEIIQHIGGVPAEPGQFENQDIAHAVRVAGLDAPEHFRKLGPSCRVLAGLALVGKLGGYGHAPVVRLPAQPFPLGVKGVLFHLHLGRYSSVDVALRFLFGSWHSSCPLSDKILGCTTGKGRCRATQPVLRFRA